MKKKTAKKVSEAVTQVAPVVRQIAKLSLENAFGEVLQLIQTAKQRAYQAVNTELITLYWQVGEYISRKIGADGWGKGTIQNLGTYLQKAQPGIRGFSPQNIWRMRQFYEAYREQPILSPLVRELPWTHHMIILGRSKMDEEREFYIRLAIREKWGKRELERQFNTSRFERTILNPIKASPVLQESHPEAANIFKDIYSLEFLGLPAEHSEADLHGGLLRNLGRFITELGRDFCFIGSEHPIQVGGQDFSLDLLFFHRGLNCLIAIELKIREFRPEDLGKLNFYLEALDRDHRKPHENPSIGLLLCATKDQEVVEYALSRSLSPALIAEYETLLPDKAMLRAKLHEFYQLCAPPEDEEKEPETSKPARRRKQP
jgi:predicted nuclease of restriction endonuclease-like (RecB) superfamily